MILLFLKQRPKDFGFGTSLLPIRKHSSYLIIGNIRRFLIIECEISSNVKIIKMYIIELNCIQSYLHCKQNILNQFFSACQKASSKFRRSCFPFRFSVANLCGDLILQFVPFDTDVLQLVQESKCSLMRNIIVISR